MLSYSRGSVYASKSLRIQRFDPMVIFRSKEAKLFQDGTQRAAHKRSAQSYSQILWISAAACVHWLPRVFFRAPGAAPMKPEIHPNYAEIKVTCSCGNEFTTRSTLGQDLHVEVCSSCHPFYTGKQKIVDSGGRVDKFRKRYAKAAS